MSAVTARFYSRNGEDYVEIQSRNDSYTVIDRPVRDTDAAKYPTEWASYKGEAPIAAQGQPADVSALMAQMQAMQAELAELRAKRGPGRPPKTED